MASAKRIPEPIPTIPPLEGVELTLTPVEATYLRALLASERTGDVVSRLRRRDPNAAEKVLGMGNFNVDIVDALDEVL